MAEALIMKESKLKHRLPPERDALLTHPHMKRSNVTREFIEGIARVWVPGGATIMKPESTVCIEFSRPKEKKGYIAFYDRQIVVGLTEDEARQIYLDLKTLFEPSKDGATSMKGGCDAID